MRGLEEGPEAVRGRAMGPSRTLLAFQSDFKGQTAALWGVFDGGTWVGCWLQPSTNNGSGAAPCDLDSQLEGAVQCQSQGTFADCLGALMPALAVARQS